MSTVPSTDVGDPLGVRDRLELHLARVAEDGLRHRPDHVDVEALDLSVEGVEEAEVVGALVHAGDEVAAGADLRHERARRHLRRPGRPQAAGRRIAGRGSRPLPPPAGPGAARGRAVTAADPGTAQAVAAPITGQRHQQQRRQPQPGGRLHRYSASRVLSPRKHPAAMTSASTMTPTSRPVNTSRPATACERKTTWSAAMRGGQRAVKAREQGAGMTWAGGGHQPHRLGVPAVVIQGPHRPVRCVPGGGRGRGRRCRAGPGAAAGGGDRVRQQGAGPRAQPVLHGLEVRLEAVVAAGVDQGEALVGAGLQRRDVGLGERRHRGGSVLARLQQVAAGHGERDGQPEQRHHRRHAMPPPGRG